MFATLAALAAATAIKCSPVPGVERLWLPDTRWVVVGEMHGTTETPEAFLNLVCSASQTGRPVFVALEYSSDWQPTLDGFLASDGGPDARAKLLTLPIWHSPTPDGRSSQAFLSLLDGLRRMRRAGLIGGVAASDTSDITKELLPRDAAMAEAWQAVPAFKNGIVLILVGNFHAIRRAVIQGQRTMHPSASLLPLANSVTINVTSNGGTAWNCMNEGCGVHQNGTARQAAAGITFSDDPERRWDATYELGVPSTASPPAVVDPPQGQP